jgi:hypothetical protein
MKMFLTMLLSNMQRKKCTNMEDVHKEIHQAIKLAMWFSQGTMKKKGLLQLALQLGFLVASDTCN